MRNRIKSGLAVVFLLFITAHLSLAQQELGLIKGKVIDASTGEGLVYANVVIEGTTTGGVTDLDGNYDLRIAPGSYLLIVSYIGYQKAEMEVVVKADETAKVNFELNPGEQLDEVIVTVQAKGQISAIHDQVASNKIVNIVSAEKMEELPDANAAEAIGRLPGISLQRSSGEADKIVIRGVSPKHNNVTIGGVKMASTNAWDRSADLSIIQSEMLSGVEVSKSLRADMDANAVGGTVDLKLASAQRGFNANARAESGYNNLFGEIGDYKFSVGASNRFFDNSFGIKAQLTYEQKGLTSHRYGGNYSGPILEQELDPEGNLTGNSFYKVRTIGTVLTERITERERLGASVILDYKSENFDVLYFNLFNKKVDNDLTRVNTYTFTSASFPYNHNISVWENDTRIWTQSFQSQFRFAGTKLDMVLSYSQVENEGNGRGFPFQQQSSGADPIDQDWLVFRDPAEVLELYGTTNAAESYMGTDNIAGSILTDKNYDAKIDWHIPFKISDKIEGKISVGGKYHRLNRKSDGWQEFVDYRWGSGAARKQAYVNMFPWVEANAGDQEGIIATNFIDNIYSQNDFLDGRYQLGWSADIDLLVENQKQFYEGNRSLYQKNGNENYNRDYSSFEESYASYLMAELNISDKLILIPGIRFEKENTDYQAYIIQLLGANANGIKGVPDSVSVSRSNQFFFPSVNLKYNLSDLVTFRGAVYKSASRPDFLSLSPLLILPENPSENFQTGNPYLNPSSVWNYDFGVELYNNKFGLLSANLFYKDVDGFITGLSPYFPFKNELIVNPPQDFFESLPGSGYFPEENMDPNSRTWISFNNFEKATYYGVEISYQKNFWYLNNRFLRGLVLDANLTLIKSETNYPYFERIVVDIDSSGFIPKNIYGYEYNTRTGKLVDQPQMILNLILGWDYKGFSSRVSFRYQDKTLKGLDAKLAFADSYYDAFKLVDISLKQNIYKGLSAYLNFTNVGNHIDEYYMKYSNGTRLPTQSEYYGSRIQAGLVYKL